MSTLIDSPTDVPGAGHVDGADVADEAGTAPGDRGFRPDVEGLRAVAVVLVVLYHAGLSGLGGGYVGVDVFFVISGFVITGLLLRERTSTNSTSLLGFYARRVRRILPAATLVIVTTVIAAYVVLGIFYADPTAVAARWTAVFLANFHFAGIGTNYLNATQPPSPLQNFWSLAVEEQFYLVFPALFLLVASVGAATSVRVRLMATLVPIVAASLLLSVVQTGSNPSAAYFSPFTRAWELALGALVAAATPLLLRLPRRMGAAMTWVGLAAIGFSAVAYSSATSYPGILVAVPVVGTALVIAGGTPVPAFGAEVLLSLRPFQWFGRLSYSLYLWHWPILVLAAEAAGENQLPFRQNIVWLVVAVLASVVTYVVVENPVRHSRFLRGRRGLTLGLGAVLVAISLVVATIAIDTHSVPPGAGATKVLGPSAALPAGDVARLVAEAPHIQSLPADLTPPLDAVRDNWGGPVGPCWPTYPQSTIPRCVFGDPTGTHTLVLYGDSHAAMWFGVINLIAILSGWRLVFLAKGNCPAVDLTVQNPSGYGSPGGAFTVCDSWRRFAAARMAATRPDLVITSQDAESGADGIVYTAEQWQTATESMIRALPVPASRVIVLGNTPETPFTGPECLSLHPGDVQQCTAPNSNYLVVHNTAEQQAATATGARYVDTVPWFCAATCTDLIGHYMPYWDSAHITADYSDVLARVLASALDLKSYQGPPGAGSGPTSTGPTSAAPSASASPGRSLRGRSHSTA